MLERGKLICSTAYDWKTRKIVFTVAIAFLILLDIFAWANIDVVSRIYGDGFLTLLIISTIFGVFYYVWAIINMITASRSHLYVYDDHIAGVTMMGLTSSNVSFSLTYDQITHVETAKKQIIIYTSFTKYTVMAMNNQYRAQEEIRKRISNNK